MRIISIIALIALAGCALNQEPEQTLISPQSTTTETGQQTPQDISAHPMFYVINGPITPAVADVLRRGGRGSANLTAASTEGSSEVFEIGSEAPGATFTQVVNLFIELWGDSASSGAQASSRAQQDVAARQDVEGKIDARAMIQAMFQAALQGQQQGGMAKDGSTASAEGGSQDLEALIKDLIDVEFKERAAETQPASPPGDPEGSE
jgi:hypothetical protein